MRSPGAEQTGTVGIALPYLTTIEDLVEAIAERVATKINSSPAVYTTNKRGPHIPGKSRRWMLTHLKTMPGARKVSRDWEIAVADYEAWVRAQDRRAVLVAIDGGRSRPPQVCSTSDDDELRAEARRALQSAGFRRSK